MLQMQRKQKRTSKSNLSARATVPPALVRIFRTQGVGLVSERIEVQGNKFVPVVETQGVLTPNPGEARKDIHRIVFFDSDITTKEVPLLVIDVHSKSQLEISSSQREIQIKFSVLTPFAATGKRLSFQAEIKIEKVATVDRVVFNKLQVFNSAGVLGIDLMSPVTIKTTDRLKALLALLPAQLPPLRLTSPNGFESTFLKACNSSFERRPRGFFPAQLGRVSCNDQWRQRKVWSLGDVL
jgi:hypothetical protein